MKAPYIQVELLLHSNPEVAMLGLGARFYVDKSQHCIHYGHNAEINVGSANTPGKLFLEAIWYFYQDIII